MEVTNANFCDVFPEVKKAIEECTFAAIDLELTGLSTVATIKNSLFDDASDRYTKIRKRSVGIAATQVGLSTFKFDRKEHKYMASTYTFHLKPQSIGSVAQFCSFEASALAFLTENQFDFNKFAYGGIPYLNENERTLLRKDINSQQLDENVSGQDIEGFLKIILEIKSWVADTNQWMLTIKEHFHLFPLIAQSVHRTFPKININIHNSQLILTKQIEHNNINKNDVNDLILNTVTGFTNVINLLKENSKPLVFHNAFFDLIIIFKQFIGNLPKTYEEFKKKSNKVFPFVYDTKYMFDIVRPQFRKEPIANNSSLSSLYKFFRENLKGVSSCLFVADIKMKEDFDSTPWFHHAGWDAYSTGFCFIRISHSIAIMDGAPHKVTNAELFEAIKNHCNTIFLSRAGQPYICLDKKDPDRHRPRYLHVEVLNVNEYNLQELANRLGKYEGIDIKRYTKNTALVAVANKFGRRRILDNFSHSKDIKISQFSIIKHSPKVRFALWSGVLLSSGSLLLYVAYKCST